MGQDRRKPGRDLSCFLAQAGLDWSALVVWKCEIRDPALLSAKLTRFLGPPGSQAAVETRP